MPVRRTSSDALDAARKRRQGGDGRCSRPEVPRTRPDRTSDGGSREATANTTSSRPTSKRPSPPSTRLGRARRRSTTAAARCSASSRSPVPRLPPARRCRRASTRRSSRRRTTRPCRARRRSSRPASPAIAGRPRCSRSARFSRRCAVLVSSRGTDDGAPRGSGSVDWKLEVVVVPVVRRRPGQAASTPSRSASPSTTTPRSATTLRVVQLTPPGSACSIVIGRGLADMPPGAVRGCSWSSPTSTRPGPRCSRAGST